MSVKNTTETKTIAIEDGADASNSTDNDGSHNACSNNHSMHTTNRNKIDTSVSSKRDSMSSSTSKFPLDRLPVPMQFMFITSGVFIFFGVHNLLQEALMKSPGFSHYGIMLGYFEVLGVTICSYIERTHVLKETQIKAPMRAYPALTLCLLLSSSLSNLSLNYINFPTKVVFRSCKLIPTMMFASLVNKKTFSWVEYACAAAICVGLICFAAADWTIAGPNFHPIGIVLVCLSICADAILPNFQEKLFRAPYNASRLEVTFYTNIYTLAAMTVTTLASGDLIGSMKVAMTGGRICQLLFVYTFIAYIAISFHMTNVKRFGSVVAVLVATVRKGLTLILSFLFFPKVFSIYYVYGAMLILGGLTISSLYKIRTKNKQSSTDTNGLFKKHHSSMSDGGSNGCDCEMAGGVGVSKNDSSTLHHRHSHHNQGQL